MAFTLCKYLWINDIFIIPLMWITFLDNSEVRQIVYDEPGLASTKEKQTDRLIREGSSLIQKIKDSRKTGSLFIAEFKHH